MKRTYTFLIAVVAGLASCAPDIKPYVPDEPEAEIIPEGMKKVQFTAAVADLTKVSMVGQSIRFASTDSIAVYDGTFKNTFKVSSIDGGIAYFTGCVKEDSDTYYAIFPYSLGGDGQPADGKFSIAFPSSQKVSTGLTFDLNALSAVAKADKVGHFQFRNISSIVTVAVPDGARKVTLAAKGDVAIAGSCTIAPGKMPEGADVTAITLEPESGAFKAGNYNICVLPAQLPQGYELTFEDEYQSESVSVDTSVEFSRTSQTDITSVSAGISWIRNFIGTAEGLRAFAANSASYNAGDVVGLSADIDLEGQDWTPFELRCTFDGRGHRIKGLNISTDNIRCGFVSILDEGAVMQNIVFGSADGENYDGTSALEYTGTSAAYQGLVAECLGTVSNVKSFVSVKHAGTDPGMRLGGIAGCVRSNGIINACEYAGTISFEAATSTANHFVGGIAGRMHETLADGTTISGSTFSGKIVIANDRVQGTGGIVGIMQGGNISNCISKGVVEISESYTNDSHFGGIAAYIQTGSSANTASITECTNATTLSASAYLCSVGGIVGDIHNYSKLIRIENCANNADITVAVAPIAQSYLSGIVGFVRDGSSYPHEITACTNNGKISYSNALSAASTFQIYTAGVLGFSKNSAGVALKDCVNNGAVSSDLYAVNSVAGIAGYLNNTSSVANCTNNAAITLNPSEEVQLGWQGGVAGIAAWLGGACKLTGNENKGDVIMNINSSSPSHAAGGIVALTDADDAALESNVNRGGISLTTTHKQAAVGGILGITKSSTTLSGNANYGSVSFIKPGETGDSFAGGVIGKIDCGAAAKTITMTKDKSLGAIVSPLRAAVLFSVIAWNETPAVTLTLSECGVGGSVNGTVVTEENYGSYLWSWKPSSVSVTGAGTCKYVNE
ncbi:MAG: hypothetical protein ACI39U_00210 [Candidatus Cryptobacteroides sp.]